MTTTLRSDQRPEVVIAGFYARGNCGDEALLQCAYEAFISSFNVTISVDEHGAYRDFKNWYPYDQTKVIHQNNLSHLDNHKIAGFCICGGGLPVGFLADQALMAKSAGIPVFALGVDKFYPNANGGTVGQRAASSYLNLFDKIFYRTLQSSTPDELQEREDIGGDLAFNLLSDGDPAISPDSETVFVVPREYPIRNIHPSYYQKLIDLIQKIKYLNLKPTWLPFCPEDTVFLKKTDLLEFCPLVESWWNPRRTLQHIKNARAVISIGRLHPLIFSANVGTPVVSIEPNAVAGWGAGLKINNFCKELSIPHVTKIEDAMIWLATTAHEKTISVEVKNQRARLATSLDYVTTHILENAEPPR